MANKNTKRLRKAVKNACRKKHDEVEYKTPVFNYHSFQGSKDGLLIKKSCPTAVVKGDGVNSVNKQRNSCQRIYLNRLESGKTASLTAHEPFLRHERMVFKNHRQYDNFEYTTPKVALAA